VLKTRRPVSDASSLIKDARNTLASANGSKRGRLNYNTSSQEAGQPLRKGWDGRREKVGGKSMEPPPILIKRRTWDNIIAYTPRNRDKVELEKNRLLH